MNKEATAKILVDLRGNKTQQQVADAVGVSAAAISQYEAGKRMPRDEVKERIAAYYRRSVKSIFFT